MKKIALFLPSFAGGGAEKAMVQLANALVARQYPVDLVVAKAEGDCKSQVNAAVNVIDLKKPRVISSLFSLVAYLRKEKPAILYSSMTHSSLVASLAKLLSRSSVSLYAREESILQRASLKDKACVFLAKYAYRYANGVIACSNGLAASLVKSLNIPASKVRCIYNPFDFDKINKLAEVPLHDARVAKKKYLLAAGRLVKQKDYPTLLNAFARVCADNDDVYLVILGQGELKQALEAQCDGLKIKDKTLFLGFEKNPYQYMKHASAFVLSSINEGLACVLVEALVCGTPVVSTDCPVGPREILQDGQLGALVPVGDDTAMAVEINKALASDGSVQFDEACFDRFRLDFIADQYVELFGL